MCEKTPLPFLTLGKNTNKMEKASHGGFLIIYIEDCKEELLQTMSAISISFLFREANPVTHRWALALLYN